jgi:parvulin-like peptidyl-prolyl isomerase
MTVASTVILQVREQSITAPEVIPLLASYQLLPQLLREIIVDQEIATYTCTAEEQENGYKAFYAQNQITTEDQLKAWLAQRNLTRPQLEALALRSLRVEKYKLATWGNKLETYFLSRKTQLDRVIYSMIRVQDQGTAQELYFRLEAAEQTFAELAAQYSLGPEANTQGLTGPVELGAIHPNLAQILTTSQVGKLWTPTQIGEWLVIVRLEKLIPAQLDEAMKQRMLQELFSRWLQEQIERLDINPNSNPALPEA